MKDIDRARIELVTHCSQVLCAIDCATLAWHFEAYNIFGLLRMRSRSTGNWAFKITETFSYGMITTLYWMIIFFNPFPIKPWFLRVRCTSLLKTLWEKEKLLVMSNFSFSHSVFYPCGELFSIFIKFEIVVCNLFHFGKV